jgi:hypothetical protein
MVTLNVKPLLHSTTVSTGWSNAFMIIDPGADGHTEDLLTIHEEEIAKLKEERKSKASIIVAIGKYFQVLEGQKELEVRIGHPFSRTPLI